MAKNDNLPYFEKVTTGRKIDASIVRLTLSKARKRIRCTCLRKVQETALMI